MTDSLRVALDWTPNTIHTGLLLAEAKGYFSAAGLSVTLLPPDADYSITPARLVLSGKADLCLCPSESLLAYAESGKGSLQAIYAILSSDASAIVSADPSIKSPRHLQGRTYASYNARYEDDIVRHMVQHDGGDGQKLSIDRDRDMLGLFDDVKAKRADATWIFLPWEGVEAELEGKELNVFRPGDYGVAYGYSPVIARNKDGQIGHDVLSKFCRAARKGYQNALEQPEEAAKVLKQHCPDRTAEFLVRSQKTLNPYYGEASKLGEMDGGKWKAWVSWLRQHGLVKAGDINVDDLYTNAHLA